jgi:rubrerythrin
MRPTQIPQTSESISPQQNPKIKKFRVLKIETRMQNVETRLEGLENEIKNKVRSEIDGIKNTVKNEIMAEIYREKIEEIDEEIKEIDKHVDEAKDEPKYAEYLKKRKNALEEKKKHIKEKIKEEQIIVEGNEKISGHICVACGAEVGEADKCPSCGLSINVSTINVPSQDKRAWDAKVGTIILFSGLITAIAAILLIL